VLDVELAEWHEDNVVSLEQNGDNIQGEYGGDFAD